MFSDKVSMNLEIGPFTIIAIIALNSPSKTN
jgi:hypothetical protein